MSEALAAPPAWRVWAAAARPRTLGAGLVPVAVGTAAAQQPHLAVAFGCAAAALLLQVASNWANDAFDGLAGIDDDTRLGPTRATQAGWLSARQLLVAAAMATAMAGAIGIPLALRGGPPIWIAGALAVLCAFAYSGGPWPLASHGLGEVAAFVFFGLLAVAGTTHLHDGSVSWLALGAALPVGALVANLMLVNNLRDRTSDARAGKRTLAVRIGERATRGLYAGLLGAALVSPALLVPAAGWSALLPWLALPLALSTWKTLRDAGDASDHQRALEATARFHLVFGVLLALGVVG